MAETPRSVKYWHVTNLDRRRLSSHSFFLHEHGGPRTAMFLPVTLTLWIGLPSQQQPIFRQSKICHRLCKFTISKFHCAVYTRQCRIWRLKTKKARMNVWWSIFDGRSWRANNPSSSISRYSPPPPTSATEFLSLSPFFSRQKLHKFLFFFGSDKSSVSLTEFRPLATLLSRRKKERVHESYFCFFFWVKVPSRSTNATHLLFFLSLYSNLHIAFYVLLST